MSRVKLFCRQLLPNAIIQFASEKNMNLKSIFLPQLKVIDENKKNKNLIYSIPCIDCDNVYWKNRLNENNAHERI